MSIERDGDLPGKCWRERAVRTLVERFVSESGAGRASAELVQVAHAVAAGAVATLLVDIEENFPGTLDPATVRLRGPR